MTSTRHRSHHEVRAFALAATLLLAAGCATAPEPPGAAARNDAVPVGDCARLHDDIASAEQARKAAAEQSGNAWKAIVPVAVLALKASGAAAVSDADRKLTALKVQARRCEAS